MSLIPCSHCGCHVLEDDAQCPHCHREPPGSARTSAAVLLGLALAGCPIASPEYGLPVTDYTDKLPTETADTGPGSTGSTGATDTGPGSTGSTGVTDTGPGSTGSTGTSDVGTIRGVTPTPGGDGHRSR